MGEAVNTLVGALGYAISEYTVLIVNGIVNLFVNIFLQTNENGTIIGLNFLGYVAIILFGLGLLCLILVVFIHHCTLAYKISVIPDDVLVDLMNEYDTNLYSQQMDDWRDLVYDLKDNYSSNDIRAQALANEMKKNL